MKTLMWTGAWLLAALSPLLAQQSDVWIANQSNSVSIQRPAGTTLTTLVNAGGFNFNLPYDIVAVPSRQLIVVSNNGATNVTGNHLTIIDSRTFAFVANVSLPGVATNARGLSVSEDEQHLFVAAEHNGNPAAFRVLLADFTPTLAGEIIDAPNFAEDVVVVSASQTGGTGSGPGKVYFSVPSVPGYIGVISINPPALITSISLGASPLVNVATPTQLARTPDHSTVFAACSTTVGNDFRIVRVAVATDTATQPIAINEPTQKTNVIHNVVFRPEAATRGYISASSAAIGLVIQEIDGNGLEIAGSGQTVTSLGRLYYDASPPQLFIGDTTGTAPTYLVAAAGATPIAVPVARNTGGGQSGPRAFAFAFPPPPPVVDTVHPKGQVTTAASSVEIRGFNFDAGAVVEFINPLGVVFQVAETFVGSGTFRADVSGLAPDLYDVRVRNPDFQSDRLARYYLPINSGAVVQTPFTTVLPSRTQGYEMRSFPQFYRVADLQAAIQAQLGGYNQNLVRMFLWNGSSYAEVNGLDPADPDDLSGQAFWVITRSGASLTLNAPECAANTQNAGAAERVVPLAPGWNMISPPFGGAVTPGNRTNWAVVLADDDSTLGSTVLATAHPDLFPAEPVEYVGGAYVTAPQLLSGRGYWIRNNAAAPVYLVFNRTAVFKGVGSEAPASAPRIFAALSAADLTPPPPPGADISDEGDDSGCGALGVEAFLLLAFLRAARRRRLAA